MSKKIAVVKRVAANANVSPKRLAAVVKGIISRKDRFI